MSTQLALLRHRSTWQHFIGSSYKDTTRWIHEAQRLGFSRRIPANVAKGMRFGDRVVFLRWGGRAFQLDPASGERKDLGGIVEAFAEGTISGLTFEDGLGGKVGSQLAAEGRASFSSAGAGLVERDCGSYVVTGGWSTSADIDELIERAQALAGEGETVFVMVTGSLSLVYEQPVLLQPGPEFHRGFSRVDDQSSFVPSADAEPPAASIVLVSGYNRK